MPRDLVPSSHRTTLLVPDESTISHERGRCYRFLLGVGLLGAVRSSSFDKSIGGSRFVWSPLTLRAVSPSSLRCCPPTISSVTTDHEAFCELPSWEGRRVA